MQRQGLRSYSWFVRFALVFQKLPGLDLWLLEIVSAIHLEKRTDLEKRSVGYSGLFVREYGTVRTWIYTLFGGSPNVVGPEYTTIKDNRVVRSLLVSLVDENNNQL